MTQPCVDFAGPTSAAGDRAAGRSAGDGGEPLAGFRLFLDLQRVVEFVEEAAERDAQGQFDDLCLAEMLAQPREEGVRDTAGLLPGGDRVFDDQLIDLVELRV